MFRLTLPKWGWFCGDVSVVDSGQWQNFGHELDGYAHGGIGLCSVGRTHNLESRKFPYQHQQRDLCLITLAERAHVGGLNPSLSYS